MIKCWKRFQSTKIVAAVGVTTVLAVIIVVLVVVLGVGSHNCTFEGYEDRSSFGARSKRKVVAFKFTDLAGTKETVKKMCQDSSKGEAKLWEILGGQVEKDEFANRAVALHKGALVQGIWINAQFQAGKIAWDSNPMQYDKRFTFDTAQAIQQLGSNHECIILQGETVETAKIVGASCNATHFGICSKKCWPKDK